MMTQHSAAAQEHQSRFSWAVAPSDCHQLHQVSSTCNWRLPVYSHGFYRTKIFAEMTICWQVPYGSTAVLVVLWYHGSTVT